MITARREGAPGSPEDGTASSIDLILQTQSPLFSEVCLVLHIFRGRRSGGVGGAPGRPPQPNLTASLFLFERCDPINIFLG